METTDNLDNILDRLKNISTEQLRKEFISREKISHSEIEEKLKQEARIKDHKRKECLRKIFHIGNIGVIVALYVIMIVGIMVLGYHWIAPESYSFLTYEQLDKIKNILFSALVTNYAKETYKITFN